MARKKTETIVPEVLPAVKTAKPKQPRKQARKHKLALRKRAQDVVKAIAEGSTIAEAGIKAGYTASYAYQGTSALLKNPTVVKSFNSILEAAGVTDPAIAGKIKSLMEARTSKYFKDLGTVEITDNAVQLGAVTLAAKLKGHLVERSVNVNVEAGFIDLSNYDNDED